MFSADHFVTTTISLLFYTCLNIVLHLKIKIPDHIRGKDARDYIGQHISLVHSIIACFLSLIVYLQDFGIDYESDFSIKYIIVLGHSMGYFTYDMIYAEIFGVHDFAMRFHHVCVMIGGYMLYIQDKGGAIGTLCVGITELSNPFMQTRLILKGEGKKDTNTYKIAELIFVSIFSFNRGFLGTFLNYNVYQYDINFVVRLFVSLIYGVSLYWIFVIFCMISKKLKNKKLDLLVVKSFNSYMDMLRANKYIVILLIFTWSIFMPPTMKMMGSEPFHLKIAGFTII